MSEEKETVQEDWSKDEMTEEDLDKVTAGNTSKWLQEMREKYRGNQPSRKGEGELTEEELTKVKAGLPRSAIKREEQGRKEEKDER